MMRLQLLGVFAVALLASIVRGSVIKKESSGAGEYARRALGVRESSYCERVRGADYPYICNNNRRCLYCPCKNVGGYACHVCNGLYECSKGEDEEGCAEQYSTANGQCTAPSQNKIGENATAFDSQMLEAHNYFRCLHAAPSMRTSAVMKRRADIAVGNIHDSCKYTFGGQNSVLIPTPIADATGFGLTKLWYDEIKDYMYDDYTQNTGIVAHFTQVVWFASVDLGCAYVEGINGITQVTCMYDPPGNINVEAYKANVKRPIGQHFH
ncbi:Golgi-associated plant pathogenesis-related protein 1-like [Ptychodera flava]|uniref:Golgi-associated plant pathogenesis-related protein 1-like n=1 Tax=Ptychodera flava TaxID=63121 RepID=UPI00396A4F19